MFAFFNHKIAELTTALQTWAVFTLHVIRQGVKMYALADALPVLAWE